MLVDIPDVGVILGVFASFIGGLIAVAVYNKVKPRLVSETENAKIPKPKEQKVQQEPPVIVKEEKPKERIQNMQFGSATDHILRLITEKPMTSRDIQVTIGRTREHTSRMLKKLFEEGLVERDMSTKPFSYKITDKGLTRIGVVKMAPAQ